MKLNTSYCYAIFSFTFEAFARVWVWFEASKWPTNHHVACIQSVSLKRFGGTGSHPIRMVLKTYSGAWFVFGCFICLFRDLACPANSCCWMRTHQLYVDSKSFPRNNSKCKLQLDLAYNVDFSSSLIWRGGGGALRTFKLSNI